MEFITIDQWDEDVWEKWKVVYHEAFGSSNGKQKMVIRNMFFKKMCRFHYLMENGVIIAVALSGILNGSNLLLIDYLAVSQKVQGRGVGKKMMFEIKKWGSEHGFTGILIEVEAEETVENIRRIQFWKKCGFTETDYVHNYKIVPETYKAMYMTFYENAELPDREEDFFLLLSNFHQKSFRGANQSI
ncbi:GNAT family N-acetyltransferase [Niallia sp. Krafla_26]|uniref:GNAT family N-acetyltransferase n=1 Tax=Niallia sp. Krafla_26 TaxID=3064703 RepID=UPI003D16BD3E